MARLGVLGLGALLLGLLCWFCQDHHQPLIAADLTARSKDALQKAGIGLAPPASLEFVERRVGKLRGYERSREVSEEAQRLIRETWGVAGVEVELIPRPASEKAQQEITEVLKLDIVEFESGSDKLTPKGQATLDKVSGILARVPDLPVGITGHTDSVGLRPANLDLSTRRAASVKTYLAAKGIAEARLTAAGKGPDEPVASNDTEEGRARNRRIEFSVKEVVVKKTQ